MKESRRWTEVKENRLILKPSKLKEEDVFQKEAEQQWSFSF